MKSNRRIQFKQCLSIAGIGKLRFWSGIVLGIFNAVIFFGFIFFILELVDLFRVIQNFDITIKSKTQLQFEKRFLFALSIAFGNNTMLRFWFSRPTKYLNKTYKYTSSRIVNYSLFIEYVVLFGAISFITRFLLYASFIDLNIFNEYGYILYLFPVYLFFIAWTEVSRYVKTQRFMLYSFSVSLFLMIQSSFIDLSNYKIGEIAFREMHHEEITYIENEVEKAKRNYNITFSDETINALKELRTERAYNLLEKTRLAFNTNGKVSLDTIIFEKILLHNMKGYYMDIHNPYTYTTPIKVYEQLRKVNPNSYEATELLNLIATFHEIGTYLYNDEIVEINTSIRGKSSLLYNNTLPGLNRNYDIMYNQTSFLIYNLQKLGTYNHHPFFNFKTSFPPPIPIYYDELKEKFPEFEL